MDALVDAVCIILQVYYFVLLARVILSWIPAPPEGLMPVVRAVYAMTEPVVRLARPLLPPLRMGAVALDLSILLVFFALVLITRVFC
ncbi:MAG TPA: YggT family protein [Actinomycetota bacterium]